MLNRIAIIIFTALLLSGCSSTKFAYQHADSGIIWWVDDYISMTGEQEAQLKRDIGELLDWHCREELPRYSQWLDELNQDVRSGQLPARVSYHQKKMLSFIPPLLHQSKPAVKQLLSSLSDKQVEELAANMVESQKELEDDFLTDDPEQTAKTLTDRTKKRIKNWLGTLNNDQNQILEQWASDRVHQTAVWLKGRRTWQNKLLEALEQRKEVGFDSAIDHLIDDYNEVRGPEYQQMAQESRISIANLLTALLEEADQQQLDFLLRRAANLRDDFIDLSCNVAEANAKGEG